MRPIHAFVAFFICCLLFGAAGSWGAGEPPPGAPSAGILENHYRFDPVLEGKEILHDFAIKNKGAADLKIEKVRTD